MRCCVHSKKYTNKTKLGVYVHIKYMNQPAASYKQETFEEIIKNVMRVFFIERIVVMETSLAPERHSVIICSENKKKNNLSIRKYIRRDLKYKHITHTTPHRKHIHNDAVVSKRWSTCESVWVYWGFNLIHRNKLDSNGFSLRIFFLFANRINYTS